MALDTILYMLLSYTGLYFGLLLAFIAPEEVKPLKRYLKWGENIFVIILLISLLLTINHIILAIFIILLFGWFIFYKKVRIPLCYFAGLLPLFIAFANANVVVAIILFLLGFPIGTLFALDSVKNNKLTKKKRTLLLNLTKETYIFWISFAVFGLLTHFIV